MFTYIPELEWHLVERIPPPRPNSPFLYSLIDTSHLNTPGSFLQDPCAIMWNVKEIEMKVLDLSLYWYPNQKVMVPCYEPRPIVRLQVRVLITWVKTLWRLICFNLLFTHQWHMENASSHSRHCLRCPWARHRPVTLLVGRCSRSCSPFTHLLYTAGVFVCVHACV